MRSLGFAAITLLLAGPLAAQAKREVIRPAGAPVNPNLSAATKAGDFLFLSGQLGSIPGKGVVEGGVAAEAKQALENIKGLLEAAGSGMDRVVKCTVFLADINDFQTMNAVYRTYWTADPPARSTVAVAGLVSNAKIEIECLALAGK